jgi:NADH-quinone oxidoreductase subunit F
MNIEQIRATAERQLSRIGDPTCIKIYVGSSANDSNADRIFGFLQSAIDQGNLHASAIRTGSFGYYDLEPIVMVDKPDFFTVLYNNVTPDGVPDLLNDFVNGMHGKVKAFCCIGDKKEHDIPNISELPLFSLQNRIALRNCGWIDPEDIHHYIGHRQGYTGLSRALRMNHPDLTGVISSTLKDRGSPDCSTADKWEIFREAEVGDKYLICNAVDTDPRSLTSRLLLESDPHSVLEGMLIGAYAVDASRCFIFVENKAEAVKKLRKALDQVRMYNLLGSNILDSTFCSEIDIIEAPASVISGYRIELFRCIEEKQPLPHMVPTFPGASEFAGKPILTVNPEVMSSLSAALRDGMKDSKGSKVVTLSGSVIHQYTVEVPSGMTIQSIIESLGGGVSGGKIIKAVQLGGPAGPFVAPDDLALPIGCNAAGESSDNIGSGSIEVLDADCRIVDTTKSIMAYIQAQSCGKCVFCREGCLQMLTILEDISENKGQPQDLNLLVELGEEMRTACLCAFGRTAPNPVLSSIKLFRVEYEERFPV